MYLLCLHVTFQHFHFNLISVFIKMFFSWGLFPKMKVIAGFAVLVETLGPTLNKASKRILKP